MRYTGVTARGIITPIFKQGDDLISTIGNCVVNAAKNEGFSINNGDIIGVTEAVVGRTQGNYATVEQIASDIRNKFGTKPLGIVFPILSRNRFSVLLKAISMATEKLYVQFSYPCDEVGNGLISRELFDSKDVDPYTDHFDEAGFRAIFGNDTVHPFTGVDYIEFYKSLNNNIEIVFSNDPKYILKYTKNVLVCDIHTRKRTQKIIKNAGAEKVLRLDEILTSSVDGSGYSEYGLLGSNKATPDKVKLFPRDTQPLVDNLQKRLFELTGKNVEILVYGDGGFKDPKGGIWELADPVVSPAFTKGLYGTPNEIKIKYVADNEFSQLSGDALTTALKEKIKTKESSLVGDMQAEGTTPRQLTDLIGSLCDLISGSGDRGTPVVLIQGYFTNYASE